MTIRWTPEMDAALVELRAQGAGYHAAGATLGVHHVAVKQRVQTLGLPTWGRGGGRKNLAGDPKQPRK